MSVEYALDQPEKPVGVQTLDELIRKAAEASSDAGIYFAHGATRNDATFHSYADIYATARMMSGALRRYGSPGHSHTVLLLEDAFDVVQATWASILGGHVPCVSAPIRQDKSRFHVHLQYVDELLGAPLFIGPQELLSELPRSLRRVSIEELRASTSGDAGSARDAAAVAMLFLTSGTTGNSKAVALSHANILAAVASKAEARQLRSTDVFFNWVAMDHVVALIEAHLLPLSIGASQVLAPAASIIADPLMFLAIIDGFRVTTTFTPNFLLGQINAQLLAGEDSAGADGLRMDLSCVRHIFTGGEANPVATGMRFLKLLEKYGLARSSLWPAWGMTETCAAATYSHDFPNHDSGRTFASVGCAIRGLEIRIVDDQGTPVEPGLIGELQVRGPVVFDLYYNNPEATRDAFTPDHWFRTGDVATLDDGRLVLAGRSKDCIIVSGVNYAGHELETALEKLSGVASTFVAAFPTRPSGAETEQLVVAFSPEFPLEDDQRLVQLIEAIRNTTVMLWGFRPHAILPLAREEFPKTNLGKIQRAIIRRRFEAGRFSSERLRSEEILRRHLGPYTKPEGEHEEVLVDLLAQMFGVDRSSLSATARFFDLGGTSLEILKLTRILHQRFGFAATLTTVLQHSSARELAAAVSRGAQSRVEYEPLVPLQLTGNGTPLFLVHPGDGGTFVFVNLAKYFVNERPIYAIRARGFNLGEECFNSFEEVVRTYVEAIRRRQPKGPYAIAGYSMGASISFEIAKCLIAQGERIEFLGCIDGQPCGSESEADFAATMQGASAVLKLIDVRHYSAWIRVANSLHTIGRSHVIEGTVPSMTIFSSSGLGTSRAAEWSRRLRGWSAWVGSPRYVEIAGDHISLMAPEHVASFQTILHAELDRAACT